MPQRCRHTPNTGERNGRARLTCEAVAQIRRASGPKFLIKRLARVYGVAPATIEAVRYGKSWRHLR